MGGEGAALHYVCTLGEARALVDSQARFWVSNCGCRENRGNCGRSRLDVCLQFKNPTAAGGSGLREVSRSDVEVILQEAELKRLVARPYRDTRNMSETEGICFCCDDCCGYFRNADETCDRGAWVETTDLSLCDDCLACVPVCHFGARMVHNGRLVLHSDNCYGCGLCLDVCPNHGIEMVPRPFP